MSKIYQLIGNRFFGFSIFFIILQQVLVATSTWVIADIGSKFASHQDVIFELTIYCSLLFIIYLPAAGGGIMLQKAQITALHTYIDRLRKSLYGKVSYYCSKKDKEKLLAWSNGEAQAVLEDALEHIHLMVNTLLNALLNAFVISIVIDKILLLAYGVSILICVIGFKFFKQRIQCATQNDIEARISLRSNLLDLWDNIVPGNLLNKAYWVFLFDKRYGTFKKRKLALEKLSRTVALFILFFALSPIVTALIWLVHQSDTPRLGALLVTLPRQIQIVQGLDETIFNAIIYAKYTTKLRALYSSLLMKPSKDPADHVDRSMITINKMPLTALQEKELLNHQTGRFTIRGKNGAGKTSFLLHLKFVLKEKAYLLPVDTKNFYHPHNKPGLSTGERMLVMLKEISKTDVPVILLDEWDANLDDKNVVVMNVLLDQVAKNKLIVEIRHKSA